MEARFVRAALLAAVLMVSMGARVRTPNFVVQTDDPQMAQQMAQAAEKFRRDLAIEWTGKVLPQWAQPCMLTAQIAPGLGAGGATTFVFDHGEVFGWRMSIQGPPDRIIDSVLPHEITHMIFASHFRRPLPRWADEGGASSVEHDSEKAKHRRMLLQFLRSNRGIAFNQMFAMTEYPRDVMPLYAQGFSLAEYMIYQGGKRKFVNYLGEGLRTNNWSAATRQFYGPQDLGSLQKTWLAWVAQGSPPLQPAGSDKSGMLVANGKLPRPEPNLIYHTGRQDNANTKPATASIYQTAANNTATISVPATLPAPDSEPIATQAAHLQPVQRPQQIILQPGQRQQ
jgi:hypothetical protein